MATIYEVLSTVSAATPFPVATAPLTAALDTVTVVQDGNSTAALTQVVSSIASVTILATNANRKEALIFNNSTGNLFWRSPAPPRRALSPSS